MGELSSPQPFEALEHTADAGVRVRGATAEETLARLIVVMAQQSTGGEPVTATTKRDIEVAGGVELSTLAVEVLGAVHRVLATERLVVASAEVLQLSAERGARVRVRFGRFEPERFKEGLDVKAITYHAARFAPDGDGWVAQVVFDI
jgi:SHS2 domain-containing protein